MKFLRRSIINSADATATINSAPIDANQLLSMSVQAVVADDAAGSVKIQASNDEAVDGVPTHWSDISGATVTLTGSAGSFLIPKLELSYRWVRIVFTRSGGDGGLIVNVMALSL